MNDYEVWKPIKGYERLYEVSNLGRVKSLSKFHRTNKLYSSIGYWTKEKILKPFIKEGYEHINLCKNKIHKTYTIHKLVAMTFISNPNNYKEVNHKDENIHNNKVDNLEWCDRSYNINFGERNKKVADKLSVEIYQYNKKGDFIKKFDSMTKASKEIGIPISNISYCCKNKRNSAGGFIWRYADGKQ